MSEDYSSRGRAKIPEHYYQIKKSDTYGCNKLDVHNWVLDIKLPKYSDFEFVEVRFKNSRKEFLRNSNNLRLEAGDIVVTEASPGYDVGIVSLTGELVRTQMKRKEIDPKNGEFKIIYRKARPSDLEKWDTAINSEVKTMIQARELVSSLKLEMKICDVEFQGDKTKAVFYYTADERVDFRELIKLYAERFKVRIEMRQIGARQKACRLGGIGSCGRELCCSTWYTDFSSVNINSARDQQLALNPLKLAGQCGKLKCCLNYELKCYCDAMKDLPDIEKKLETAEGTAFFQKSDVYKKLMWYSYTTQPGIFIEVTVDRVKEIIELNNKGIKPEVLTEIVEDEDEVKEMGYDNVVGQDSLTRFDKKKKSKNKNRNKKKRNKNPNFQSDVIKDI